MKITGRQAVLLFFVVYMAIQFVLQIADDEKNNGYTWVVVPIGSQIPNTSFLFSGATTHDANGNDQISLMFTNIQTGNTSQMDSFRPGDVIQDDTIVQSVLVHNVPDSGIEVTALYVGQPDGKFVSRWIRRIFSPWTICSQ